MILIVVRGAPLIYIKSFGIPIRRGRGFSDEDRKPREQAVILSEALRRRFFRNDDSIGKLMPGGEPTEFAIRAALGNIQLLSTA